MKVIFFSFNYRCKWTVGGNLTGDGCTNKTPTGTRSLLPPADGVCVWMREDCMEPCLCGPGRLSGGNVFPPRPGCFVRQVLLFSSVQRRWEEDLIWSPSLLTLPPSFYFLIPFADSSLQKDSVRLSLFNKDALNKTTSTRQLTKSDVELMFTLMDYFSFYKGKRTASSEREEQVGFLQRSRAKADNNRKDRKSD